MWISIVRHIFALACEGRNANDTAKTLREERVLIPAAYSEKYHPENARHHSYHDPYLWTNVSVIYILERMEYLGHTVLGKSICENFKTKKRRKVESDELMVFPDTHEAIIDQATWDRAQKMRKRMPGKVASGTYSHRLSGLVFCADCGARMSYSSPGRFLALLDRYRDMTELTDDMLYELIDRIEVHAVTGGRTRYRQQRIDVHFSFIGDFAVPAETMTEEERIAEIDAEAEAKLQEKRRRANERRKEQYEQLREAAKTDPEAAAKLEALVQRRRESGKRHQEKIRAAREADPAYIQAMEAKEREKLEKQLEKERKRQERSLKKKKETRHELVERAMTDPQAAEELTALKAKEKAIRDRKKAEQEARMAADPAYAEEVIRKRKEYNRRGNERKCARLCALREQALTDPEAAVKLAEIRAYNCAATKKSMQKMYDAAAAGDPAAVERYEHILEKRRNDYRMKVEAAKAAASAQ